MAPSPLTRARLHHLLLVPGHRLPFPLVGGGCLGIGGGRLLVGGGPVGAVGAGGFNPLLGQRGLVGFRAVVVHVGSLLDVDGPPWRRPGRGRLPDPLAPVYPAAGEDKPRTAGPDEAPSEARVVTGTSARPVTAGGTAAAPAK